MIGTGIAFSFAVLVVAGVSVFAKFFLGDPCEGDGNFRDPPEFQYDDRDDEEQDDRKR